MVGNPPHGSSEGPATLFGPLEFQGVYTVYFCAYTISEPEIPYVVDGFSKSGVYHLRLSSVYPGDFTWVFYTSQLVSFRDFLHGPLATTSSHLAVQRWEGHGGLHGCGGADPVLVQHPVAWGEITPVPPIRRPLSKVVSTHLWNTPLNLYQQAIKGFLS